MVVVLAMEVDGAVFGGVNYQRHVRSVADLPVRGKKQWLDNFG
jgi:hypothetical protein